MQFKDYYQILGIDKTATPDDIKKAYRKLARKYHPDVSKEADASQKMSEVNEANTVLSDPEKRKAYDTLGHEAYNQAGTHAQEAAEAMRSGAGAGAFGRRAGGAGAGAGFGGGFGGFGGGGAHDFQPPPNWGDYEFSTNGDDGAAHSEFFEQLFGRQARARSAYQRQQSAGNQPVRGRDQHASIELDILESYQGTEKTLQLQTYKLNAQGVPEPDLRTLQVKIPKGVRAGQMIRLAGQGDPGLNGGAAGDLLLEVSFKPDARWSADGKDVSQKLPLAPWEAALGASVAVHTPTGEVEVTVPAGIQPGKKLRLKGRGLPAQEPGDLYLDISIAWPKPSSDAQTAAYESMKTAFAGFNPRTGA